MAERQDSRHLEKIVDIGEIFEKGPAIEAPLHLSSQANDRSLNL